MSVYRSTAAGPGASRALLCVSCGATARVRNDDEHFACAKCGLEQPTVRADASFEVRDMRATSHEAAGYAELVPFARSVGLEKLAAQITLRCDGVEATVTLSLNSGTPDGIDLEAHTSGFPEIQFTLEGDDEVMAKERGLSREVQTGDAAFDRAVYIRADAVADADVLTILEPPAVRRAILALLERFESVKLSPEGVTARQDNEKPSCFEPQRIARALGALRAIAGAPRPLSLAPVERRTSFVGALSVAVLPIGTVATIASLVAHPPVQASGLVIAGVFIGLLIALLLRPLLFRAVRGRATSHEALFLGTITSFLGWPLVAVGTLVGANGLFDRSPERVDRLRVTAVKPDPEGDAVTASASGTSDQVSVNVDFADASREIVVGSTLEIATRGGAFGVRHQTKRAVLVTPSGKRFVEK